MGTTPCRRCGSDEIWEREVEAKGFEGPDLLPIKGLFRSGKFRIEVCGACGLVEWFVPERFIPEIRKTFEKRQRDPPTA